MFGEVAIAGRRGFERRYALAEHVIPAELLDAAGRGRRGARARRAAPRRLRRGDRRPISPTTGASRTARAVHGRDRRPRGRRRAAPVTVAGLEQSAGRPAKAWVHRDATLPRRIDAAALLTPFDPVVWFRDRAERLFDFEYRIEIYTPGPKRRFGYYSLPVLSATTSSAGSTSRPTAQRPRCWSQSAWWEHGRPADAAARARGRAAAGRALAGSRDDLGVTVGRCHRRPRRRAARGAPARGGRRRAVALADDEPEPAGIGA